MAWQKGGGVRKPEQVRFRQAHLNGEHRRSDYILTVEVEIVRHWAYISSGGDGEALTCGEPKAVRCFA